MGIFDTITSLDADAASKGGPAGSVIEKKIKLPNVNYTYVKGEVVEYISNPASYVERTYKDSETGEIKKVSEVLYNVSNEDVGQKIVKNNKLARFMPANSIFVQVDPNDPTSEPIIAYPFFPSHFSLPLKVGERVWLIQENKGSSKTEYYWMCRVAGDRQSEDLNHTNVDRGQSIRVLSDEYSQKGNVSDENLIIPTLTPEKFKNPMMPKNQSVSSAQISSVAFREEHVCEPVPRTYGNCSDLILQGSNNTTIQMTTEKFREVKDITSQTFFSKEGTVDTGNLHVPLAGTIDMFVGKEKTRMRDLAEAPDPEALSSPGEFNVKLSKRLLGAQGFETYETSKIDEYTLGKENSKEGNDSPRNVFSRLYLGMNASPDDSFEFQNSDFTDHGIGGSAVLYSEHVRCYAENSLRLHVYPPTGENSDEGLDDLPGGALLDIANDGTITLQSGQGDQAAKIILRSDGNIVIKPGSNGILHLGGDESEKSGVAVSVGHLEGPPAPGVVLPMVPPQTDTFGGTAFLGNDVSGYTSTKVVIKV